MLIVWNAIFKATRPKQVEGMESKSATDGIGGTAPAYAASLKAQATSLQDELLTSKYRANYEEAIINLSDLVGASMLRQALQVTAATQAADLANLNTLATARASLNETMKYLNSLSD